jgi:uncharacterized repeat protein (TIGR02543 family)
MKAILSFLKAFFFTSFYLVVNAIPLTAQTYPELPVLNWEQRSDWLNVKDLPSDVNGGNSAIGDGENDDTEAIQAAFDAVRVDGSTYSTVYLPEGTYKITQEIYPKYPGHDKAMHLRGHGRNTRIVWYGPSGGRMFRSDGAAYSTYIGVVWDGRGVAAYGFMHDSSLNGARETRVLHEHEAFMNFTAEGAGAAQNKPDQRYLEGSTWKNCLFINNGKGLVLWDANDYVITVEGCEFHDNNYGIWAKRGQFFVRATHFRNSSQVDIVSDNDTQSCSVRRVTSVGSGAFYERAGTTGGVLFTMQDCHISGWTNTNYAIKATSTSRHPMLIFDCSFNDAPSSNPPVSLGGATVVIHSNNVWTTGGAFVGGNTTHVQEIPQGTRGGSLTSANQKFFSSTAKIPGKVFHATSFNSAGIQNAIDSARIHGNGAIAYLPRGTYNLTQTINITGGDYYIGGAGSTFTKIYWKAGTIGPAFLISNPQNITITNLGFWGNATLSHELCQMRILGSPTQASHIYINNVFIESPNRTSPSTAYGDLEVKDLASGSVLTLDLFRTSHSKGQLTFDNCAAATIMLNDADGNVGIKGTSTERTGFMGVQTLAGTFLIEDNHSIVGSDCYMEQAKREYARLKGAAGLPAGRVTISSPRMHTWKARNVGWEDDFIIENYHGSLASVAAKLDNASEPNTIYRFKHTGSNPFNIVCMANAYKDAGPSFDVGSGVERSVIGNWVYSTSPSGNFYAIPDVTHANSMLHASQALDHFRELGEHDLVVNYGIGGASTYTVSYNSNGGTGTIANATKTHDVPLSLSNGSGFTRTGYTFVGWNTLSDGSGTDYAASGTYSTNAAQTFYAKWTAVPSGGGEVTEPFNTSSSASTNGWIGSNNTISPDNYDWADTDVVLGTGTGGAAGGVFSRRAAYSYFADTTIAAIDRTSTIRLAGSFRLVNDNFDGSFYVGYFDPSDPGNNFVGIGFSEPSGSTDFRGFASVNHNTNSGIVSLPQSTTYSFDLTWTGNADGSGTLSGTIAGQNVSVTAGAGTGNFTAFGLLNGGMPSNSTQKTGNCYFDNLTYNKATPETYTVSYDANGGTGTIADTTKIHDVDLTLSDGSGFIRTGYTFAGWNTMADGSGTDHAASETYSNNASQTFYAKWTAEASGTLATGGDLIEDIVVGGVNYRVHHFTSATSHTFQVLANSLDIEYLIVGGGGGSGGLSSSNASGAGGAGGYLTNVGGSPLTLGTGSHEIIVGAGGAGGSTSGTRGAQGANSSAFGLTTIGGGGGGGNLQQSGGNGGSGGGGGPNTAAAGNGTAGQGNAGGNGFGGGGGAGATGQAAGTGDGLQNSITGSAVWYAGGGRGAFKSTTPMGGGGNADTSSGGNQATDGQPNTGGGGGAIWNASAKAGRSGGSGIVIVRYANESATPETYTVSYYANEGAGTIVDDIKTHDVDLILSDGSGFTRTGYTFDGWNTNADGTGNNYAPSGTYSINSNQTFYAKWSANTYTVSYNANGGTGTIADTTKIHDEDLTLSDGSGFNRVRYTFAGWNTQSDGSGTDYAVSEQYATNAPQTFYAKWTTESYVSEVTEPFNTSSSTETNGWIGSNNRVSPDNFGWADTYVVLGTGTGGAAGGVFSRRAAYSYFADTTIWTFDRKTDTLHLTGNFRLTNSNFDGSFYVGYFDPSDPGNNFVGIGFSEPSGSTDFRGFASVNHSTNSGIVSLPQSTTYSFDLTWIGNADGSGTLSGTIAGQNVSVTAGAGTGNFTAFGLLNGGMPSSSLEKTGNCYFDNLSYRKVNSTATYIVSYDANGGTGTIADTTKTHDVDLILSDGSGFTLTGYTFSGWNTQADGSGNNYDASGTYSTNVAQTFYARWTANTYTVSYDANGGTGTIANATKTHDVDLTLSDGTGFTRTGYAFTGWNTLANGTGTDYDASGTYSTNAAQTFYAQWEQLSVLWWKFDETSGTTAADASGNGKTGALFNGIAFGTNTITGEFGNALNFDGTNDVVRHTSNAGITGYPFTLSAWVKTTNSTSGQKTIVYAGDATTDNKYFRISVAGGQPQLSARNTTEFNVSSGITISDGNWHHVAGVFSSATDRKLYVDGVPKVSSTDNVAFPTLNRISAGALDRDTPVDYFPGGIDDVRVYSRALSGSEIQDLTVGLKIAHYDSGASKSVDDEISIYPNPATDWVYFNNVPENSRIVLVDMTGKIIVEKNASDLGTGLSLQPFNSGLYLIRVLHGQELVKSVKILKK